MALTQAQVGLTLRALPDPGMPADWERMEDADYEALADRLLDGRAGPLRVFAYGSLIWKPGFETGARARGTAHGWHRSFCLHLTQWRGTEAVPGLMLALQSGGSTTGLVIDAAEPARAALDKLLRRELIAKEHAGMARWVKVRLDTGERVDALTFWANPDGPIVIELPAEEQAWRLAHACGHGGSGAEYLHETVRALDAEGIRDRGLWHLQELVAEEIAAWGGAPPCLEG
ncbi:gamma-glutamylcyclotransferase [Frigidibacter sp. MR17.24]|uniref:gamma-glutamylcyclotransferase n=1 Tax=Frigidibacter sp. MR17.24 TaxID=3127345 RepID=UPI003012DBF6